MSLRHYLRGLGIGILFTALFLGLTGDKKELTDAEIKIRAAQLGMIEDTVLADLEEETQEPIDTPVEEDTGSIEEKTEEVKETKASLKEEESFAEEDSNEAEVQTQPREGKEMQADVNEENFVEFTIDPGSNGVMVAEKLFKSGLISSQEEYNQYLRDTGYSRKLRSGTHRIPQGASIEEITRILCWLD